MLNHRNPRVDSTREKSTERLKEILGEFIWKLYFAWVVYSRPVFLFSFKFDVTCALLFRRIVRSPKLWEFYKRELYSLPLLCRYFYGIVTEIDLGRETWESRASEETERRRATRQKSYIRGISLQFDQDLAVMSQVFSVVFYIKVPIKKCIPNFFYFSFLIYHLKKNRHLVT